MGDNDKPDWMETVENVYKLYEEHKDKLDHVTESHNEVTVSEREPHKSVICEDDKVIITMETKTDGLEEITINETMQGVELGVGDHTLRADVPNDVDMDTVDANMNNGVLEVKIERNKGGE